MSFNLLFLAGVVVLATSACTSEMGYNTLQAMQRENCEKAVDMQERQYCLSKSNTSYDDYKRQSGAAKKLP